VNLGRVCLDLHTGENSVFSFTIFSEGIPAIHTCLCFFCYYQLPCV
jgi:hypothetical protein